MSIPGNGCKCGYQYELHQTNSVIYYYECQPWFSYASTTCPRCQVRTVLFFPDQHDEYMAFFIIGDFHFINLQFASEALVEEYERVFELHARHEYQLTPRLEREIHALGDWLATAPDEWIHAMFEECAPPKERSDTWID